MSLPFPNEIIKYVFRKQDGELVAWAEKYRKDAQKRGYTCLGKLEAIYKHEQCPCCSRWDIIAYVEFYQEVEELSEEEEKFIDGWLERLEKAPERRCMTGS